MTEIMRSNAQRVSAHRRQRAAPVAPRSAAPGAHRAGRLVRALSRGILRDDAVRSGALPAAGRRRPISMRRSMPSQLHQILWNLCENALQARARTDGSARASNCVSRASRATGVSAWKSPTAARAWRSGRCRAHLRALLHARRARHRPGTVPGARARRDQRRDAAVRGAQGRRQRLPARVRRLRRAGPRRCCPATPLPDFWRASV